jgi:hypothetical protein
MPRRASTILWSFACLFAAPGLALAAGPVTPRVATPNVGGSQVDPSVAVTSTGQRLIAATDADAPGGPVVEVWKPATNPTPTGQQTTWDGTPTSGAATHPALAWAGGSATASLATETPSTCTDAVANDVGIATWSYDPTAKSVTSSLEALTFAADGRQTWPRMVLGSTGSTVDGKALIVADEQECGPLGTGQAHNVVLMWRRGSQIVPLLVAPGRMPAVAVLGTDDFPTQTPPDQPPPPATKATALEIAYLSEPSGGQQDVMAVKCWVADNGLPLLQCDGPQTVDNNIVVPGTITSNGASVTPLAAPAVACNGTGTCHVVWTEAVNGGSRTRVYISHAADPYTTWTARVQVASAAASSASQFMPSVTAHGSRADVAYLDTRPTGASFDAFQTSLDLNGARGSDVSLTGNVPFSPGAASVGDRTDIADFGTNGTVYAYFTNGLPGDPVVDETQVDHGTVDPNLTLLAQTKSIDKNTSTSIANWLAWSDPDGDPVTLTVPDPLHGTISGSTYTPDTTYAGDDSVSVKVVEAVTGKMKSTVHTMTMVNHGPTFFAPQPVTVGEGATIVVPLSATDPDVGDIVNFSVVQPAPAPFNATGHAIATIDGSDLRLTIPAGVRAPGSNALTLLLRASDTTTGELPMTDMQTISVTIDPNLKTPSVSVNGNIVVTGLHLTTSALVAWTDAAGSCIAQRSCDVEYRWTFGDGSAPATFLNDRAVWHDYAKPGKYVGSVTAVIHLGSAPAIASPPTSFNVIAQIDGRLAFKVKPTVTGKRSTRTVTVKVTSVITGAVTVSLKVKGKTFAPRPLRLVAHHSGVVTFKIRVRGLKSHRATIKVTAVGLASGVTPTPVTRTIRF